MTFPTDDAHSAFITTVIEGVGIGSDFGSVVVLPVSGGMAAYRHQVLPLTSEQTVPHACRSHACIQGSRVTPDLKSCGLLSTVPQQIVCQLIRAIP